MPRIVIIVAISSSFYKLYQSVRSQINNSLTFIFEQISNNNAVFIRRWRSVGKEWIVNNEVHAQIYIVWLKFSRL
jgi:hypothetical protein